MKFALLADVPFSGAATGGVQSAVLSLCEGLAYHSHRYAIEVVSVSKEVPEDTVRVVDGIRYHFLRSVRGFLQRPGTLWNVPRVVKRLRSLQPDAVNIIDHPTMALAGARGDYPKVFTVHGMKQVEARLWRGAEYLSHQYEAVLEKISYRTYKNFIAVSPYAAELLRGSVPERDTIFEIPNAVSEYYFDSSLRQRAGRELSLLNIGSYTQLKSQHLLIEAVREMQKEIPVQCVCCGPVNDPAYFESLQSMAGGSPAVQLRRSVSRDELKQLLIHCDVLVHTSKQENSPMIFLEAMAMGVPVVSSRVGGVPFLLGGDTRGTSYEYGNTAELRRILQTYVQDRTGFELKADAARAYVAQNHHPRAVAEKTLATLRSLVR